MSVGRPILVVVILGALVGSAGAGSVTEELRPSIDRVMTILADPALQGPANTAARRAALRQAMDEAIDFREAARRALGIHWAARTDAERREFVTLFRDLVEQSYIGRIEPYSGQTVVWAGEAVEGKYATVRTRIRPRHGEEIAVDYRLHRPGARWLVYDVSVGGVSLVANYRAQFNTIIQTSSYAELLARMRARVSELPAL